jgi:non-specific serine/threonine protein kinase
MFWRTRGHYGEGKKWLQAALAKDDRASAALRVKALQAVFWLTYYQMDLNGAEAVAQEAIDLSAEAEIDSSLAPSLRIMLAGPARVRGDYERAKELLEKSLALSREVDDKVMISDALSQLAVTTHKLGDTARAKEILGEGIALCREVGYTYRLCEFLVSRGYVSLLDGEYKRAVALSEEAAALSREYGYKRGLQFAQVGLGWAALLQGNYERARTLYEESLTLCQELNDKLTSSENLDGLACVAGAQGEVARAGRLFGAAEALREAVHKAVAFQHQLEVDTWREPYLASARSRLGEAAWEEVLAQGRIMGLEQAIEYALSEEESQTPEQTSAGAQPPNLTPREQEVALLVGRGLTNRQIAQELSISERTVENHIGKILKKLGFSSRARIATWVAQR